MTTLVWIIGLLLGAAILAGLVMAYRTWRMKTKVEAICPPRGTFTEISTGRLHYLDKGQGRPILFIHGLGSQMGSFDMALLDRLTDQFRCVAIDRPGMGYSARPGNAPANLRAQAGYVAEVIDKLGLEKPLIVGHSLGGGIGMALAVDHADKIGGLALLAPLARPNFEPSTAFDGLNLPSPLMRWLVSWTLATPMSMKNRDQTNEQVFGPDAVPPDHPVKGAGMLILRPESFRNASRDYLSSATDLQAMAAEYGKITLPVHILYGREDRILDAAHHGAGLAAEFPHFQLREITGGHMLPMVHVDATVDFIRNAAKEVFAD